MRMTRMTLRTAAGLLLVLAGAAGCSPSEQAAGGPTEVKPWPGDEKGMLFSCRNPISTTRARDVDGKSVLEAGFYYELQARGVAILGPHAAMRLEGGSYVAPKVDEAFAAAFRAKGQLTLEALVAPTSPEQEGPAEIVSFASTVGDHNFCLAQKKDALVFRMKTSGAGAEWVELGRLATGRAEHVVVTYEPGRLVCFLNGKKAFSSDKVTGDFSGWEPRPLVFGNNWSSARPWRGLIEGITLYARAMGPEEVGGHWQATRAILATRKPIPRMVVQAKLLRVSAWPGPRTQTYPVATTLYEYEVEKVLEGSGSVGKFMVAHFLWADFELLEPTGFKAGESRRLVLEPLEVHNELKEVRSYESLERDLEAPVYLDVGPLVPLPNKK